MSDEPQTFESFWRQQRKQAATYGRYDDDYHSQVVRNIVHHQGAMREIYGKFPPPWWVWKHDEPLRLVRARR